MIKKKLEEIAMSKVLKFLYFRMLFYRKAFLLQLIKIFFERKSFK